MDLRDREGITQIVFDPQNSSLKENFSKIKSESVISINGIVEKRIGSTSNAQPPTGAIEVHASGNDCYNVSKTPPFPMDDSADKVGEELKMTYRYLDLRRQSNLDILRLRHKTNQSIRNYLDSVNFTEVETPMLFKSSEGAREFLVPSRMNLVHFMRFHNHLSNINRCSWSQGWRNIIN